MRPPTLHLLLDTLIVSVWLINGLLCKVLNLVPRHQQIVARILGEEQARSFTLLIGLAEIFMAAWIVSRKAPRLNAIVQIITILVMNLLEFFLVPDLLLWGRFNALFALLLVALIWYNHRQVQRKSFIQT